MKLIDGYDRTGKRALECLRMTFPEIAALKYGDHPHFIDNKGKLRTLKVNGQVKRWKRDPFRLEVPVKYGMYEYDRFSTEEALRRFVVVTEVSWMGPKLTSL